MKKRLPGFFFNLSIFNKMLISFVLTSLVSVSVASYAIQAASSRIIINKALQASLREMDLVMNNYVSTISHLEQHLDFLSKDNEMQKLVKALTPNEFSLQSDYLIHNYLTKKVLENFIHTVSDYPLAAGAAILTESSGDFLIYENSGFSFPNEDIITLAGSLKPASSSWHGPYYIKDSNVGINKNVLLLARPITDNITNERLGVLFLSINENSISSILNSQKLKELETLLIVDRNDNIISSNKKLLLNREVDPGLWKLIPGNTGDYNYIEQTGNSNDNLVVIKTIPYNGWHMVYTIPIRAITQENQFLKAFLAVIYIVSIFISLLLAYLFSKTITKPIIKLLTVMNRIKRGEYDARSDDESKDEIGMASSIFNSTMDIMKDLMNNIYVEQQQKREYEFKLLQAQIKPHFLYNTIETVVVLIKLGLKEEAISVAHCLCNFYRGSLSKGMDVITIEKEVDIIKNYLIIQKQRYDDYLDYSIDVSPEIMDCVIPKLTIQPLIENAIYHGLKIKGEKGILKILACEKDGTIYFEIYDNGVGFSQKKLNETLNSFKTHLNRNTKGMGFGLASIDWRIKLYFGTRYGLNIRSSDLPENSYTAVTLTIPGQKIQEGLENA